MANDQAQTSSSTTEAEPPRKPPGVGAHQRIRSVIVAVVRCTFSLPWVFWLYIGFRTNLLAESEGFAFLGGFSVLMLAGIWWTRCVGLLFFGVLSLLAGFLAWLLAH